MNLTGQTVQQKTGLGGRKKPATPAERQHMNACHKVPCVICNHYGFVQNSATTAHHWIMGRGQQRKTPNSETIALCDGHHQGDWDTSKVAVHREPKLWRKLYGRDKDWLDKTKELIADTV